MSNELNELTLKEPDLVEKFLINFVDLIKKNLSTVLTVSAGAFIAYGAYVGYHYVQDAKNAKASDAFMKVLKEYPSKQAPSLDPTENAATSVNKTVETFIPKVDTFLKEFPSSSISGVAHLYKARAFMSQGKLPEADASYKMAEKILPRSTNVLALEGQAFVAMNQKQYAAAEALWKKLSEDLNNPLRALHTWNLGLCLELESKMTEATKVYQSFEKNFPTSELLSKVKLKLASPS